MQTCLCVIKTPLASDRESRPRVRGRKRDRKSEREGGRQEERLRERKKDSCFKKGSCFKKQEEHKRERSPLARAQEKKKQGEQQRERGKRSLHPRVGQLKLPFICAREHLAITLSADGLR